MAEKKVFSAATKAKFEEELRYLKNEGLKERVEELQVARGFGDLSENYEYKIARERMDNANNRIAELEDILLNGEIYSVKPGASKAGFGNIVTIEDVNTEKRKVYELVGDFEADLNVTPVKICYTSPIGKILMGVEVGDEVDYVFNGKEVTYEIIDIK